ncbi:MAG: hypothetical protein GF398_16420 [Chitinivibrionales bacterium]|nr:hypothetical protein [Chitinivibrionales bacterium]
MEIGAWNRPDPADQYWNSFGYAGCNPINKVDPTGGVVEGLNDGTIGEATTLSAAGPYITLSKVAPDIATYIWYDSKVYSYAEVSRYVNLSSMGVLPNFFDYGLGQMADITNVLDYAATFVPVVKPWTWALSSGLAIASDAQQMYLGKKLASSKLGVDITLPTFDFAVDAAFNLVPQSRAVKAVNAGFGLTINAVRDMSGYSIDAMQKQAK